MTWWHDAVVYQIYPRSFADANGDGTGDLAGITSRLDYLAGLGVDAIWLSPFYPSPLRDGGYDVADYCDVNPLFGTLDDFDRMVAGATERRIRVIVDIVPNHCSSEHPRFQAALAAAPGSPERDLFMFRDGRGPEGSEPPNNWQSFFGGGAWTRVPDGQWYLHLFDESQPDWNWANPAVAALFEDVLRFWLDRGVAGFRVDVANHLYKDPTLPDDDKPLSFGVPNSRTHRPELHDLYRTWRAILDEYSATGSASADGEFPGERTAIAENWALPQHLRPYLENQGLNQTFNPMLLVLPWNGPSLRTGIDTMLDLTDGVAGRAPWVLGNHDIVRPATRYGWTEYRLFTQPGPDSVINHDQGAQRARAAALLELALPGSAYVYQGEELGLPEVFAIPDDQRDDPTFFRTKGERVGRDGCRVPMPWSGSATPFGFSPDGATPWLPQPPEWAGLTVEAEEADADSMLHLYRAAIAARPSGDFTWVSAPDADHLEFSRGSSFTCIANTGESARPLPDVPVILASGPLDDDGSLPPDTTVWLAT